MEIDNPQSFDHIIEANGAVLRVKVISIGVWDMDTVNEVAVAHGVTYTDIREVKVMILRDLGDMMEPLMKMPNNLSGVMQGSVRRIDATMIRLDRLNGGVFDDTDYNDGVMNRGFITIWYSD